MKLSLKQKALLQTLGLVASGALSGIVIVALFNYFTMGTILTGIGIAFASYLLFLVYHINLSQLEYKETLKQMTKERG